MEQPDGILDLANEMLHDRENGKLVTVAMVAVYADGSSQWMLRGEQRPQPVIYELELMKLAILSEDE
jgi:hypothetical protein